MEISVKKSYGPAFKAKIALEEISANKTVFEQSSEFIIHPSVINKSVINKRMGQRRKSAVEIFVGEIKIIINLYQFYF